MKTKKLFLFLLFVFVAVLLVSCQSTDTGDNGTGETTSDDQTKDIPLMDNGKFTFTVIRPERGEESIISAASELRKQLEEISGSEVTMADDFLKAGEEHDPNAYEILVGHTNYAESAELYEGTNYGTYRIAVMGNKIVLAAHDGTSMLKAAYSLIFHIEDLIKSGDPVISGDYTASQKVNSLLSDIPAFKEGSLYLCYNGAHNDNGFVYKSTSPESLTGYTELLKSNGCKLYSSTEHGKNLAATLTKGDAVISLFYTAADKKTRVIIESSKNTAYTSLENKSYESTCGSLLVQLGLEPSDPDYMSTSAPTYSNGMGYIYRLADGSFIIIDGGFNTDTNANKIYDKLCELAPDKDNIVIAAWIITHQHVDHIGALDTFTSLFSSRVKLELVIYNFPTTEECGTIINGNPHNADKFYQYIKKYSGVKQVIAHPGQIYNIRNAEIEMLHTIDLMRGDVKMEDSNSVCLMFRIEIEGQTFLFPADSYQDMTAVLVKNYGSYLKSDFVQVIHHGSNGGSVAFYKAVDPTVVLWPVGHYYYSKFTGYSQNSYFFESATVKEIILAGNTDRTLELPYAYPADKIIPAA